MKRAIKITAIVLVIAMMAVSCSQYICPAYSSGAEKAGTSNNQRS